MSEAKVRVVVGTSPPSVGAAPTWTAFGDPDDHLRLTALIAAHVVAAPVAARVREAAETCLTAAVGWRPRLDALRYLLEHWSLPDGGPPAVLFDVDALDPGPVRTETLWDDRAFVRQRREFLAAVLPAATRGGWVLVRPRPSAALTLELGEAAESEEPEIATGAAEGAPEALLDVLAPESRPLLVWLLQTSVLRVRDVERLLEAGGPEGFEPDIIDVVYDALPAPARAAARWLSALRRPQARNGTLGPFHLLAEREAAVPDVFEEPWLPREGVEVLCRAGVLQPFADGSVRMPRAVRDQLRALAARGMPDHIEAFHRARGAEPLDGLPLEDRLEAHFHAVHGGSLPDALRTAACYATDLRELAFHWSHQRRHGDAASVYRAIVEEYDPDDSYAWEYLGYNLALACGDEEPSVTRAHEILRAYRRAWELDRKNPLYHGRLLGFRALLGEDVEVEFHRGMKRYLTDYGEATEAISYFAEPVLRGMSRGGWGRRRSHVVARWRPLLRRFSRLHPLLGQDDAS